MNRVLRQTVSTTRSALSTPHHHTRRKASTSALGDPSSSTSTSASTSKRHSDTLPSELDIVGTVPYHKSYTLVQHTHSPHTFPSKVNNLTLVGSYCTGMVSTSARNGLVNHWYDPISTMGPPVFGNNVKDEAAKRTDGERFADITFGVDKLGRNGRLLSVQEKIRISLKEDPEWKGRSEEERRARRKVMEEAAKKKRDKNGYPVLYTDLYDDPVLDEELNPVVTFESNTFLKKSHTLLLVCTHGARDCRCGDTGGELVKALQEELARRKKKLFGLSKLLWQGVKIGEIAHVGGHKYAANMIVFPYGDWLGNLRPHHAPQIFDRLHEHLLLYRAQREYASSKVPLAPLTPLSTPSSQKSKPPPPATVVPRDRPSAASASVLFLPSIEELKKGQKLEEAETEQEHMAHMPPLLPDRSLWRGRMGLTKEEARILMDTYEKEVACRQELRRDFVNEVPLPEFLKKWILGRK